MLQTLDSIKATLQAGLQQLYGFEANDSQIVLSSTRKEFEGDYTLVVFPFTKQAKKSPPQIAEELGQYIVEQDDHIASFNVVKGFLNLAFEQKVWTDFFNASLADDNYGAGQATGKKVMVEFSSPNTNKPLHLGHIRNILLGWSCSKILEFTGNEVIKTQIINDRGIHICKSMVAWQQEGNGATPKSTDTKGDHFVGKYYVKYNNIESTQKAAFAEDSKEETAILQEARVMLKKWEENDSEVRGLWQKMNSWVYDGFNQTYADLGVSFDREYYESQTYLLGKKYIEQGVKDKIFYTKEDGSVWIDLEDAKMDQKLVLRSDGTSVYMTQDIGTAQVRHEDFQMDKLVYVVGDEQNYHFKVLFEIMKRLGVSYADGLYHLSYGMVDLPSGRMKSREGKVVDADDLIEEVINAIRSNAEERGSLVDSSAEEQTEIFRKLGLGALKYFILKVNPKKRMVFNPEESVDIHGNTGPYIQNAYVRIQSVLRKAGEGFDAKQVAAYGAWQPLEKELVALVSQFPNVTQQAAKDLDPSSVANYAFELAKTYHKFYHDHQILNAATTEEKHYRLAVSALVAKVLKTAMHLLGIEMPQKM